MTTPDSIRCAIHLEDPSDSHDRTQGYLEVPCAGTVVIDLVSPRPLRLRVGDLPVLDEDLWWRRFERWLRAIVTLPMTAGAHRLHAVYGPLARWPSVLDEQCPSRNREHVRQELRERRPDRFKLAAAVQPGAAAIACNLRVIPAQCVIGGVTFQHVLATAVDRCEGRSARHQLRSSWDAASLGTGPAFGACPLPCARRQ